MVLRYRAHVAQASSKVAIDICIIRDIERMGWKEKKIF